jgi:hypothetical protein
MLAKGMKVNVWEKPISRQSLEGVATLTKFVAELEVGLEVWMVRFKSETRWVSRKINLGDVVKA